MTQASNQPQGRRAGKVMLILAWIAGLLLAAQFFGKWEQARHNPNQTPVSLQGAGYVDVQLAGNGQGHYVLNGGINGRHVRFLLDTGATDVAVPGALAQALGLEAGAPVSVNTANGRSTGYRTRLGELTLGDIRLQDVRALIVPGMDGDEVLLGMSALKQLEFTQRDGTLVLRHYTDPRT